MTRAGNPAPKRLLDTDLIASLRHTKSLTQRALARRLNVSSLVVKNLELGNNHTELTLSFIAELAAALGCSPGELFYEERQLSAPEASVADDARVVEALVANVRTGVSQQQAATILGWDMKKTAAAFAAIHERLAGLGIRLIQGAEGWQLRARLSALPKEATVKAVRTASERRSLKLGEANCLLDAVDGNLNGRWEQNATNPQRVALSSLLKMRLVTRTQSGYGISDTAAFSLDLE